MHMSPNPAPAASVHAHKRNTLSRPGGVGGRSQLVELGATKCMCWTVFKKQKIVTFTLCLPTADVLCLSTTCTLCLLTAGKLRLSTAGRIRRSTVGRLCLSTAGRLSLSAAVHSRQTGPVRSRQRRTLFLTFFYLLYVICDEPQLRVSTHRQTMSISPQQRSGHVPKTCCR